MTWLISTLNVLTLNLLVRFKLSILYITCYYWIANYFAIFYQSPIICGVNFVSVVVWAVFDVDVLRVRSMSSAESM